MLTMIDMKNGRYSIQFGKSAFAESLNELNTSRANPSILVISHEGMFALNQTNDLIVVDSYYANPCINSSKPIYTDWQSFENGVAVAAHAMVVCGFYLNTEIHGPGYSYGSVRVMDPNYSYYQLFSLIPGLKYKSYDKDFTWYSSVY